MIVYEDKTYNLLTQRNYFKKKSPAACLQKSVLQMYRKFRRGDPDGNKYDFNKVAEHFCRGTILKPFYKFAENLLRRTHLGDCVCVLHHLLWCEE